MGNIEIKQQSPNKRRTSIFKDKDDNKKISRKSLTPNNKSQSGFSPIKHSSKRKQIFDTALTQRKSNSSRLKSSKFSNSKAYMSFIKNNQQTGRETKNTSNVKSFVEHTPRIKIIQKENKIIYEKKSPRMGKIVPNPRRNNLDYTIQSKYTRQYDGLQNSDIIKKVRNFNDFLNEIKRKLKQDKQKIYQRKKSNQSKFKYPTLKKQQIYQKSQYQIRNKQYNNFDENVVNRLFEDTKSHQNTKETRKLQVALKLQNQKLQLQKYRKLVQRQLSKNHSIQSISLSTRKSGQRILTIQYENLANSQRNLNNMNNINRKSSQQSQQYGQKMNKQSKQMNNLFKKSKTETQSNISNERVFLQKLKSEYQITMRNMINLGKQIDMYEKKLNQEQMRQQKQQNIAFQDDSFNVTSRINGQSTNRSEQQINKIQSLFSKLSIIQEKFVDTDRQIKKLIDSNQQDPAAESSNSYFSQQRDSLYNINI